MATIANTEDIELIPKLVEMNDREEWILSGLLYVLQAQEECQRVIANICRRWMKTAIIFAACDESVSARSLCCGVEVSGVDRRVHDKSLGRLERVACPRENMSSIPTIASGEYSNRIHARLSSTVRDDAQAR